MIVYWATLKKFVSRKRGKFSWLELFKIDQILHVVRVDLGTFFPLNMCYLSLHLKGT